MKITLITTLSSLIENQRLQEEAEKMGHQFQLIDLKNFNYRIKDNQLIIPPLQNLDTDLIIVRGIFNSLKSISTIINHYRQKNIKVFDNHLLSHLYSIDKVTDMVKLSLNHIPTPNTSYSRDYSDFPQLAKQLGYPLIVKSTRMGKGANIFKLDNPEQLTSLLDNLKNKDIKPKGLLLQQFIPYIYDLRILCIGNQTFTMRRIPKKNEFRANFSLGGSVELFDPKPETVKLAHQALKAVDMTIAGIDVLITQDNQQYILEVNHTAGFVGMEKATGKNIAKIWLEHAINTAK